MSKNEIERNDIVEIDVKDNILLSANKNMYEIETLNRILKSLHRSIEFSEYSNEEFNKDEIVCILRKLNDDFSVKINTALDAIDNLESELNKIENESKEDKKRLARIAYAFINNGEIERAKKELEKVFMK